MECCGTPFKIGDEIKWLVCHCDFSLNTPVDMGKIDYCYDEHEVTGNELFWLIGTVEHIQILYERHAPHKDHPHMLVAVSGKLIEADHAEGFEKPIDEMKPSGYLVKISNYSVQPIK